MPIPQLNNKRSSQSWRSNKKKYYVNRKKRENWSAKNIKRKKAVKLKKGPEFSFDNFKKKAILYLSLAFLAGILSLFIFIAVLSRGVTDVSKLIDRQQAQSTKIFDRTGEELLYEIHGDEKRTTVPFGEIPDYVKWATIAIEDKNFYKHKGISLWGIFRGVVIETIRRGRAQGGSTLTQQFVKNAILSSERSIVRKFKEWILAYRIEKIYTKDEILNFYLNEIPYGSTAYGVEAASQRYFGKSVRDINLPQAAVLAALPQAPSRYSPYGSNKDILIGRQHYIIDLMLEQGYITEPKADAAKLYALEFKAPIANITAPHFVMHVKEILSEKYGEKMVEQGGLKIYTTLDLYKQQIAEEVIDELTPKNEERYEATNAALVSIDPKTGQILAMVGSRDYFNEEIDGQVNITTSNRQPGSSLKPIVYATAFLKGYTPDTVLYDVVTNFSNDPAKPYEPHNYDSEEHGPVTMRKALAGSLNIPAVKAIYLAGTDNVLDLAQDLGYSTLEDRDRFGLSLVLGGGEVKLIEHTNAYSAFAREGLIAPITTILKVEDRDGKIIEEFELKEKKVLDPKIARIINDILSDNDARAYAFGERNWLTLGSRPVAAKTGTTNDYRDAWTIGYTPSIVTGVWVGNNDNSEMKRGAAGGTVAAPIWHDYMQKVLGDTPVEYFRKPEISKTGKAILDGEVGEPEIIKIDKSSGLLATEYTPAHLIEERTYFEPHSILYYVDKDDPLGDAPKKPEKDPQFELWESRIIEWAASTSTNATTTFSDEPPPTETDNLHLPENLPKVKIITPGKNDLITSPFLNVRIDTTAPRGINRAEYYINDNLLSVNNSYPFNLEKRLNFLKNGFHNLKVRVCDDVDNCTVEEIEFNLILTDEVEEKAISISFTSPSSGLAVTNIDFPLSLRFKATAPDYISKITVYYLGEEAQEPEVITVIAPVENENVLASWAEAPDSGTYRVYAEAISWSKETAKTEETMLIVNNISPKETEDSESGE